MTVWSFSCILQLHWYSDHPLAFQLLSLASPFLSVQIVLVALFIKMYNMIQQSKLHNLNYPSSRCLKCCFWTAVVSWEIKVLNNSKALIFGHSAEWSILACLFRYRFAAFWSCLAHTPSRPGIYSIICTCKFAFITLSLQMDHAGVLATVSVETWGCNARAHYQYFKPCIECYWFCKAPAVHPAAVLTASWQIPPQPLFNAILDPILKPTGPLQ